MKLTRTEALDLHRWMWMDMQEKLGDKPVSGERVRFKEKCILLIMDKVAVNVLLFGLLMLVMKISIIIEYLFLKF